MVNDRGALSYKQICEYIPFTGTTKTGECKPGEKLFLTIGKDIDLFVEPVSGNVMLRESQRVVVCWRKDGLIWIGPGNSTEVTVGLLERYTGMPYVFRDGRVHYAETDSLVCHGDTIRTISVTHEQFISSWSNYP